MLKDNSITIYKKLTEYCRSRIFNQERAPGKGSFIPPQSKVKKTWGCIAPTLSSNIENLILHLESEAQKRRRKLIHYLTCNDPLEEENLVAS